MEKYNPGLCTHHRVSENRPDNHKEGKIWHRLIITISPNSPAQQEPCWPGHQVAILSHLGTAFPVSQRGAFPFPPLFSHPFLCLFEKLNSLRVTGLKVKSPRKCPEPWDGELPWEKCCGPDRARKDWMKSMLEQLFLQNLPWASDFQPNCRTNSQRSHLSSKQTHRYLLPDSPWMTPSTFCALP